MCRTRCRGQSKDCRDIWRTRKSPISKAEYRCPEKSQAYTSTTHTTSRHKHNTKYRANFTPLKRHPFSSTPSLTHSFIPQEFTALNSQNIVLTYLFNTPPETVPFALPAGGSTLPSAGTATTENYTKTVHSRHAGPSERNLNFCLSCQSTNNVR